MKVKEPRKLMQRHVGLLAKDFMGKGVVTVMQDMKVEKAIKAMDEHNIGSVVITDSMGPCGVFTERDLLTRVLARGRDPESTTIAEVASPKFPSISSSETLEEAAAAMISRKSRLMVFEGSELVGIVTPTDVVKVLRSVTEEFSILKVISTRVVAVLPETPMDVVVKLMDEMKIGSVLLAEDGKWNAIFTERDLLKRILASKRRLDTQLRDVASRPLVTADPGILGREAASLMALHGFKRLPLTLKDEGIGIVTARDIVEAFATSKRPLAPRVDWVQWN